MKNFFILRPSGLPILKLKTKNQGYFECLENGSISDVIFFFEVPYRLKIGIYWKGDFGDEYLFDIYNIVKGNEIHQPFSSIEINSSEQKFYFRYPPIKLKDYNDNIKKIWNNIKKYYEQCPHYSELIKNADIIG